MKKSLHVLAHEEGSYSVVGPLFKKVWKPLIYRLGVTCCKLFYLIQESTECMWDVSRVCKTTQDIVTAMSRHDVLAYIRNLS